MKTNVKNMISKNQYEIFINASLQLDGLLLHSEIKSGEHKDASISLED